MGDLHHLLEPRPGVRAGDPVHRGGALGERIGDLPGFGIARAGAGVAIGQADLDQAHADRADHVVVEVALTAHHDDLVRHAGGVGQAVHAARRRDR